MNITVEFNLNGVKLWERTFYLARGTFKEQELLHGYLYALHKILPRGSTITLLLNHTKHINHIPQRMLGKIVHTGTGNYNIETLLINRREELTKNYILVFKQGDSYDIITFNHPTYLQGIISVLEGFGINPTDHIDSILDMKLTRYTYK